MAKMLEEERLFILFVLQRAMQDSSVYAPVLPPLAPPRILFFSRTVNSS